MISSNSELPSRNLLRVHILTDGLPDYSTLPDGTFILRNATIGKDFHWEQRKELHFEGIPTIENGNLICTIPVEDYICSVIASEMNPGAPEEFLKAHAVISRSWAIGKLTHAHTDGNAGKIHSDDCIIDWMDTADHHDVDICNDDHCQRFQGIPSDKARAEAARRAVEATSGLVITDRDGNIADARFSKCCGGKTELFSSCWQNASPHYLQSFDDPFCNLSAMTTEERNRFIISVMNDYDRSARMDGWSVTVSKSFISQRLKELLGIDIGTIDSIEPIITGPSGRHCLIRINGSERSLDVGKELTIRRLLSSDCLLSSCFDITDVGDSFRLDGRGWGHGVGLCQTGAARMATLGHSFRDILAFYYPGSILKTL